MRRNLVILLGFLVFSSPALAQDGVSKAGIAFVAPGLIVASETATIHFGGGGNSFGPTALESVLTSDTSLTRRGWINLKRDWECSRWV